MLFGLFGCNNYEPIDPSISQLFVTNKKGKIFYRYVPGGAVTARISELSTQSPKTFRPLSRVFAKDNEKVFFEDHLIDNADAASFEVLPDYPELWGKDKDRIFFKEHELEGFLAEGSTIHNEYFISSHDRAMLILRSLFEGGYFHTYDIPVEDPASFSGVNSIYERKVYPNHPLGKDKHWYYVHDIKLPIASYNAQVHSVEHPISIASGNTLYLLYFHFTAPHIIAERLPQSLEVINDAAIGSFRRNQYHLFSIQGFDGLESLSEFWLRDGKGVYFLMNGRLTLYSAEGDHAYSLHMDIENVLHSENGYLMCFYRNLELPIIKAYSSEAEILSNWVVIDQGKVYANGEWIEQADAESFMKVNDWHYMDKNFYYFDTFSKAPSKLPEEAYEKIKSSKATWEDYL